MNIIMKNETVSFIRDHCRRKDGYLKPLQSYRWWVKKKSVHILEYIFEETAFLPDNAPWPQRVWHIINGSTTCRNPECSNLPLWSTQSSSYRHFCSKKCSAVDEETRNKARNTNLDRYGGHPMRNDEIKKSIKTNLIKKYGVDSFSKTETFKEKFQMTSIERYGVNNPMKDSGIKQRFKDSCLEKYGVTYPIQNDLVLQKRTDTNVEKYGGPSPMNSTEVVNKQKNSIYEKYGVYNSKHIGIENKLTYLRDKQWLYHEHHDNKRPLCDIAKELGVDNTTVSNYMYQHGLDVARYPQSAQEEILTEYIISRFSTKVIRNNKRIIPPKEIDIWVPEYRLAIEFNGVFWHSPERCGGVGKWFEYHQYKIDACEEKDICLLHLWENYGDHELLIDQAILNGYIDNNLEEIYNNIYKEK